MSEYTLRLFAEFQLEINIFCFLYDSNYLREDLKVERRIPSKIVFFFAMIALGNYLSISLKIFMVILTLNVYLWFVR